MLTVEEEEEPQPPVKPLGKPDRSVLRNTHIHKWS